jgi:hypothetical protein
MRDLPLPTFPFADLTAGAATRRSIIARIDHALVIWRERRERTDQRERISAKNSTAPHSHALSGGRAERLVRS